jgi:hypothetical protein
MAKSKNPHESKMRMSSVLKKSVPNKTSKTTKAQNNLKGKTLSQAKPVVNFSVSANDRERFDTVLDHHERGLSEVESKSEDVIRGMERLAELLPRLHLPSGTQTEQQIARANSLNLRFRKLLKKLHDEMESISSSFGDRSTKNPLSGMRT